VKRPPTKGLHNGGVRCPHNFWVSLSTFVTGDRAQLVGLNIPLRYIVKASYARHCANPNVVGHAARQIDDRRTKDKKSETTLCLKR
jgi:hypothetical protein